MQVSNAIFEVDQARQFSVEPAADALPLTEGEARAIEMYKQFVAGMPGVDIFNVHKLLRDEGHTELDARLKIIGDNLEPKMEPADVQAEIIASLKRQPDELLYKAPSDPAIAR